MTIICDVDNDGRNNEEEVQLNSNQPNEAMIIKLKCHTILILQSSGSL
jgi:hypothetical protein